MGRLARFILFFTGDMDDDNPSGKRSNIVGIGRVGYMVL